MPELVNYHQMSWRYARHYGHAKVVSGLALALFDTTLSGYALAGMVAYAATGGVETVWLWVTGIGGFVFAVVIYLAAQYLTFLASGHSETTSAARGDRALFGPRARKAANSKFIMMLTQFDVGLSLFSVGYMIVTDVYGIFKWLWHGGIPTNLPQFLVGAAINIGIVSFTFSFAYSGVQKGMRILEYSYQEQEREFGEGEAAKQAAQKSGYTINALGSSTPSPSPSQKKPVLGAGQGRSSQQKALPAGKPLSQQEIMRLARTGEIDDEDDGGGYSTMPPLKRTH